MKIHDVVQGTPEWLALRAGIPTASELKNLITPGGKVKPWTDEMPQTYLARKLAERWHGQPLQTWSGGAMEQGTILEPEAARWYELEYETDLQHPGFVTTDDGTFGCSPDATTDFYGLEIKCPELPNHVKWRIAGECPDDHLLQCQGGMYVTGFAEWVFVSYNRSFPKLVATVKRDEKLQQAIEQALAGFKNQMDKAWAAMCELNGAPPKPRQVRAREAVEAFDPFAVAPVGSKANFEVNL